jgi:hypothetical protein
LAPRPRALKRPLVFPAEPPIRLGLPPALRTAASTCFSKRVPPFRHDCAQGRGGCGNGLRNRRPSRTICRIRSRESHRERIAALRTNTSGGAETAVRPALQLATNAGP